MKDSIIRISITLLDIDPAIWRRIEAPASMTLEGLHDVIQVVMGWADYHLHHFQFGDAMYGAPTPEDREMNDGHKVKLSTALVDGERVFQYLYAYGDGWCCVVVLEAVVPAVTGVAYPRLVEGARRGPPEDVGGPWGYGEFLEAIAEKSATRFELKELLDPARKRDLENYLWGLEIIDFLLDNPSTRFTVEEFVRTLRKLQPRLYSIASSLKAHPEQVHFLVASVRYESHGRGREGVATTYLADRVTLGSEVSMFVHVAKGFRLPEDPSTPVIMVGPGTGLAPFRAYLEERGAAGAPGKNWLFFGEQRRKCDFFYKEQLEELQKQGVLTRFDTAFSRDQPNKIYVQHRMLEQSKDIYDWLESGAHFFVCGDAARMAKDVDVALHQIIEKHGGKTPEQAAEYVETLRKEKRYKRDVY